MLKIYLESYGCTLNHGEARRASELLTAGGHELIPEPEQAQLVMLFTCTVIKTTERKMLRRTREFFEAGKPLVVSGCMAVVQRDEILKANPDANLMRPGEIENIYEVINKISSDLHLQHSLQIEPNKHLPKHRPHYARSAQTPAEQKQTGNGKSIDAIIPISTGCRGQCNYCITRFARGALKSIPDEEIIKAVRSALNTDHYELRLTAQDSACYGYDMDNGGSLADLLVKITALENLPEFRVRVGMMNPNSAQPILDELINSFTHPRIFKFLHIPVQSGSDEVLEAMGRQYTVADFLAIIKRFRSAFPQLSLATDIIIGYPGETNEQFGQSMELIESIQPNMVNITRFSSRPGTPAANLKTLPGKVIKARSREMTKLRFKISQRLNTRQVGSKYSVLVAERVKKGSVLARNDNYQPVVIKAPLDLGSWVDVKITEVTDAYLIGEVTM